MSEEIKTQAEEVTKPAEEETVKVPVEEVKDEAPKEEATIADTIPVVEEKKHPKPETIPFDVFENMKKELKEEIRDLKKDLGPKDSVVSDLDLRSLASKHDVSEDFLADFAKAVEDKATGAFEERFQGLEAKDKQKEVEKALDTAYGEAMEGLPEYNGIVVPDVIKTLALKPENQNKTFSQLIEATYGNAIPGKRTIEETTPRGGQEPMKLDVKRAQTDTAYFKEVMADPELKAAYNEGLENRINF